MKKEFLEKYQHVYFIGIGGISMSGLAEVLKSWGLAVSGSDAKSSRVTQRLADMGVVVHLGQRQENITKNMDLVVYTAAIKADNPEFVAAKQLGIPMMDRAHLLGLIMEDYPDSIAIAGTHGKTTTTSMVSEILLLADLDPTITLGGILPAIDSNIRIGQSPYFVAEACEYFDSFLQFYPKVGAILNVEADHLDYFKTLENIRKSFHTFGTNVPSDGLLVVDASIEDVGELTKDIPCRVEYFGLEQQYPHAQWQAREICHEENGHSHFQLYYNNQPLGQIDLNVPGDHNVKNALAACGAVRYFGISFEAMQRGLFHFGGTDRRFQRKGEKNGVMVIDDYAHHPTEVRAMLAAAKGVRHREIWCVFQPHTYSRTKYLFDQFVRAFQDADHIIIADTFAAREKEADGITGQRFSEEVQKQGKDARYVGDFSRIVAHLEENLKPGDLLLTVGAGNVYEIGESYLKETQ